MSTVNDDINVSCNVSQSALQDEEADVGTKHGCATSDIIASSHLPSTSMTQTSACYFSVKGAAIVLPKNDVINNAKSNAHHSGDPIQEHLHNMLLLLQPEDTLKMAVKLESLRSERNRYLAIVSRNVGEGFEEFCLIGFDCNVTTTIGLVLPIWANTSIDLDGDGGFRVISQSHHLIMKPISVQAMWSALHSLHRATAKARDRHYVLGGITHSWVNEYEDKINSEQSCLNEWHFMEDIESRRPPTPDPNKSKPTEREETEVIIRAKLREIMMNVDLDLVTCKFLRVSIEEALNMNLQDYRKFIDSEMLTIFGQLDAPTKIFDYLYLGSEWNASDYQELTKNGITHILNVTREIDNFFPGKFDYINIRVYDEEITDLLKYWDQTYRYIVEAKNQGKKCLVHCKMGKSRSASVVIAYIMKVYNWSLERAFEFVKTKRNCIKPNEGFLKQLETYQGILDASRQRHSKLWRSKSETNLNADWNQQNSCHDGGKGIRRPRTPDTEEEVNAKISKESLFLEIPGSHCRPKSWSPNENMTENIFPKSAPSSPIQERKKMNLDSMESSSSDSLQTVVSIRDRISEFESQHSSYSKEMDVLNLNNKSGLVLNLATQFEAVSKSNTPSPIDEEGKENIRNSVKSEVEPPAKSLKPNRHEAVLVKPSVCSKYVIIEDNIVGSDDQKENEAMRSASSTSIDSGVSCQSKVVENSNCNNKSVPLRRSCSESSKSGVMKSSSSSSVHGGTLLSPILWQNEFFTYEKEDIPWTPGTVWRTTKQLEENTLKRTKSFDSALKLKTGKTMHNEDSSLHVHRSQSLSAHKGDCKLLPIAPPLPPVRKSSKNRKHCVMHSSSSPSLSMLSSVYNQTITSPLGAKLHLCRSDEGLIMSSSCNIYKSKSGSSQTAFPFFTTCDDAFDSVGVVRRLTQELEAKSIKGPKIPTFLQKRSNRSRIKSESIQYTSADSCPDFNLQRSCSASAVSPHSTHKSRFLNMPKKSDNSSLRVITSQNILGDNKQIPNTKPPPASKSLRKMRKHQQDYGKNHPMNKLVSRALQETTFNAV